MLNPFPDLLTYGLLAPFLVRVVLGAFLIIRGQALYRKYKILTPENTPNRPKVLALGVVQVIAGVMLFLGFYTQIAALVVALWAAGVLTYNKHKGISLSETDTFLHIFIFTIALSLMFSSAGAFAIDLPL